MKKAIDIIKGLTAEPEVGKIYKGTVRASSTSAPSSRSSPAPTACSTSRSSAHEPRPTGHRRLKEGDEIRSRSSRWTSRARSGSVAQGSAARDGRLGGRARLVRMVTRSRSPNGLRVLSERCWRAVGHGRASGSRTARATRRSEQAGISHFLEHLFFKGTERRTAAQIAEEIDAVGGVLNAFTGKEYTCYYAQGARRAPAAGAATCSATSSCIRVRPGGDRARAHGDPAGDLAGRGHARRLRPRPVQAGVLARASAVASRSAARRRPCGPLQRDGLPRLPRGPLPSRPGAASALPARCGTTSWSRSVQRRSADSAGTGAAVDQPPAPRAGLTVHEKAARAGAHLPRRARDRACRARPLRGVSPEPGARRRHELAALPGGPRDAGPGVLGVLVPARLPRRRLPRRLRRHQRRVGAEVVAVIQASWQDRGATGCGAEELARSKNQLKGSLLLGLETSDSRMSRIAKNEIYFRRDVPLEEVAAASTR